MVTLAACDRSLSRRPGAVSPLPTPPLISGPAPATIPAEPVIILQRSGGIAGICRKLVIDSAGMYNLVNCMTDTPIHSGEIPADKKEQID
jgi:hypothetical protein